MQLEILTPEATFYRGEVDSITLPGALGSFQLLNNHRPHYLVTHPGNTLLFEPGDASRKWK